MDAGTWSLRRCITLFGPLKMFKKSILNYGAAGIEYLRNVVTDLAGLKKFCFI